MNCNVCIEDIKVLDLGCYSHCGIIKLGIKANYSGLHTYMYNFGTFTHVFQKYARKGEYLKLDNNFNENSKFELTIQNPDGTDYKAYIFNKILAIKETYNKFKLCIRPTKVQIPASCDWCCLEIEECENEPIN